MWDNQERGVLTLSGSPDARYLFGLYETLTRQGIEVPLPADDLAELAHHQLLLLAEGSTPGDWHMEAHRRLHRQEDSAPGGSASSAAEVATFELPEREIDYKVVVCPIDGLDSQRLESELRTAASDGFKIERVFHDQPLGDGKHGHVIIMVHD